MTTMMEPVEHVRPGAGPGWGIVADLTPPEVRDRRRMSGLRRAVVAGVALTALVCVGAFAFAVMQARSAEESLAQTQDRTNTLTAQQSEYRDVIKVQADTAALDTQIAELMKADVDVATVAQRFRTTLPGSMSLTSINVALDAASGAAPAPGATAPAETTGKIGTVTLSGTSQRLSDLASYVANVEGLDGVVNVLPSSNAAGEKGAAASWTITLDLTKDLHSHRYDVTKGDR